MNFYRLFHKVEVVVKFIWRSSKVILVDYDYNEYYLVLF